MAEGGNRSYLSPDFSDCGNAPYQFLALIQHATPSLGDRTTACRVELPREWCVFRTNVTGRFGIVTGDFGNVTGHFGNVTDRTGRQGWRCA
ncbi:hypothetical protein E1J61_34820 [Cupriavidus sp. L7L]|nr:hypothetical protein E1J61_34820 [Cupriavidus sp. L7L]